MLLLIVIVLSIPLVLSQNFNNTDLEEIMKNSSLRVKSDQVRNQIKHNILSTSSDIRILLYKSRHNPVPVLLEISDSAIHTLKSLDFHIKHKSVFLIHGLGGSEHTHMPSILRDAYLKSEYFYNIIVVDWGNYATKLDYNAVVYKNLGIVAKHLADFIKFLIAKDLIQLERIHFVGHSLGAHLAGQVGKILQKDNNKIGRITGLDPAALHFSDHSPHAVQDRRLSSYDAKFVDVYHTMSGGIGTQLRLGHADFFVNRGRVQPGCPLLNGGPCSHSFSWEWYSTTISGYDTYRACKCYPFSDVLVIITVCEGHCDEQATAGEYCSRSTRGEFQFFTPPHPLFSY